MRLHSSAPALHPATSRDPACGCQRNCLAQFRVMQAGLYNTMISHIDAAVAAAKESQSTEQNVSPASRHYAGGDTKSVVPDTKAAVTAQETATAVSIK